MNTQKNLPLTEDWYKSQDSQYRDQARALFYNSGVPGRHRKQENLIPNGKWQETKMVLNSLLGANGIIVLLGLRGTGKTQLAVEAIRTACKMHYTAKYTKAIDIFLKIRETWLTKDTSESAVIRSFVNPKLLVIDAMEVRGETDFENRMLNHIIDLRYDNEYGTILISNQTKSALIKSIGNSIISRIHETGNVFECTWESFRVKK